MAVIEQHIENRVKKGDVVSDLLKIELIQDEWETSIYRNVPVLLQESKLSA